MWKFSLAKQMRAQLAEVMLPMGWAALFRAFDTDGDGTLNQREFVMAVQRAMQPQVSQPCTGRDGWRGACSVTRLRRRGRTR